jgi:hypothetical protein
VTRCVRRPIERSRSTIDGSRDEAIAHACERAARLGRVGAFFVLKDQVLRGFAIHGSARAIGDCWIPTKSPSNFSLVVTSREPYLGPHGSTVPDGLFRAAVASRGGFLGLVPVMVAGRLVGVIAADGLADELESTRDQLQSIGRALGSRFGELVKDAKR